VEGQCHKECSSTVEETKGRGKDKGESKENERIAGENDQIWRYVLHPKTSVLIEIRLQTGPSGSRLVRPAACIGSF
jgi:hypothetical protein